MESGALDQYIPQWFVKNLPQSFLNFISHNPYVVLVAIVFFILILLYGIMKKFKKKKRKKLSHNFLCGKRRKSVLDSVDSFYISNPKVSFTVTVSDLVARGILDEKHSKCPSKGLFSLSLKRDKKGHLFDAKLTCSIHGVTGLSE